ncbi:hypothetical protein [Ascidiimonas sp. W6]|uniref:hypothetical protein n=1 Tax=Ascidiimonas meishanensis TaxID=3128903 RepID=UPI0030EBE750
MKYFCLNTSFIRFISFIVVFNCYVFSYGQVGIGTTIPEAVLDVNSTESGILIPRLTSLQRDAIVSPVVSMMIFNSTENVFQFCSAVTPNVIWKSVTNSPSLKYVASINTTSPDLSISGNGSASRMPIFDFPSWNDDTTLFTSITSGGTTLNVSQPGRYRITLNAYVSVNTSGSAAIRYYVDGSRASGGAAIVSNPNLTNVLNTTVHLSEIIEITSVPAAITVQVDEITPNTDLRLLASPTSGVSVNNIQIEKLN